MHDDGPLLNPCSPCCCPGAPCEQCMFGYRSKEDNHNLMEKLIRKVLNGEKPLGWKNAEYYMRLDRDWKKKINYDESKEPVTQIKEERKSNMLSLREAIGTVIDHNSLVDIWGPEKDEDGATLRTWRGMGHEIPNKYLDSVNWRVCGILRDNPMDSDIVNIKIFDTEFKKATVCGDVIEKPQSKIKTSVIASSSLLEIRNMLNDFLKDLKGKLIDIKYSSCMATKVSRPGTNNYMHEYSALVIYTEEE